eukprot:2656005-Prymnesium_polylepis.1
MCEPQPLSLLDDLTGGVNDVGGDGAGGDGAGCEESGPAYSKSDAIRDLTRASRERSRSQGRNGCCGKASTYLESTGPPVDKGRWSRDA